MNCIRLLPIENVALWGQWTDKRAVEQGMQNLYDRIDRMSTLGPAFIDITWNAGGRLSNLTCEMVNMTQSVYGVETCMHLTCTGMPKEKVDGALKVRG